MKNSISLFEDTVEYYKNSGLSKCGRFVLEDGKNHAYVAKQAAIDMQRKWWKHEMQFLPEGKADGQFAEFADRDPEMTRYASDELGDFNSAAEEPNQEDLASFNETVRKMLTVLEASENENHTDGKMVQMLFLKIRRANVEHYLEPDLLARCIKACANAAPETDFEEAQAMELPDTLRGKSHSNRHSRIRHCMQESLKKSNLAA